MTTSNSTSSRTPVSKAGEPALDPVEVNELAVELARDGAAELISDLSATNKKVVRSIIARGLEQGWSDTELRKRIGEVVGLDPRSAQAVQNYRAGLAAQNVPPGRIDRQADAYAKRLLKARIKVIAVNETRDVLQQAQRLLWTQMQQNGDVSRWAVRVTRVHKDERLCPICQSKNGQRNSLKHQNGGPPFHPNCRCDEELVDQGIEKAGPEGQDLYVKGPITMLTKCQKCGRKHKSKNCPIMPERMSA